MKLHYTLPVVPVCLSILTSVLGRDIQESEPQYSIFCIDVYTVIVSYASSIPSGASLTASHTLKAYVDQFRKEHIPVETFITTSKPKPKGKGNGRKNTAHEVVPRLLSYDLALSLTMNAIKIHFVDCYDKNGGGTSSSDDGNSRMKHMRTVHPLDIASVTLESVLKACDALMHQDQ